MLAVASGCSNRSASLVASTATVSALHSKDAKTHPDSDKMQQQQHVVCSSLLVQYFQTQGIPVGVKALDTAS